MNKAGASVSAGEAIAALHAAQWPTSTSDALHAHLIDSLGLIIAGTRDDWVRRAVRAVDDDPAFLLSLACGALGLDDFDEATRAHPGAVLVPALLAAAAGHAKPITGTDFAAALVAGYQVFAGLGAAMDAGSLHLRGRHPSAVLGLPSAAVAVARMLRAESPTLAAALGIGAAFSCGLTEFDEHETMRAVQTAWAASGGVRAARLAAVGLTASPHAIDAPRGLLGPQGTAGEVELVRWPPFAIERVSVKPYPHFSDLHPVTFALVQALGGRRLEPGSIVAVHARITKDAGSRLSTEWPPMSTRAAKRSARFALAVCIIRAPDADPASMLEAFRADRLDDPAILSTARRIGVRDDLSNGDEQAVVEVHLEDGTTMSGSAHGYPGDGREPALRCTTTQAWARFDAFVSSADDIDTALAEVLADTIGEVLSTLDIRPLARTIVRLLPPRD